MSFATILGYGLSGAACSSKGGVGMSAYRVDFSISGLDRTFVYFYIPDQFYGLNDIVAYVFCGGTCVHGTGAGSHAFQFDQIASGAAWAFGDFLYS